jgi:hypothetical protein
MKKAYGPSQPIKTLFDQLENTNELAATANAAYAPAQIVVYAYNTVFQTRLFTNACRNWCRNWCCKSVVDKTWPDFKTNFALTHQDLCESQFISQGAGFHSANLLLQDSLQQQTFKALANLTIATESDRSAVSNLTCTNIALTLQLLQTNNLLESARADITALKAKVSSLRSTISNNNNNNCFNNYNNRNDHRTPPICEQFNTNYCCTREYHIHISHTSQTCKAP